MVFGICLLVALYLLWVLLVKGALWKLILGIFGWLGMYWFLHAYPILQHYPINIYGNTFSWAAIIPSVVVLLAMMHTKED